MTHNVENRVCILHIYVLSLAECLLKDWLFLIRLFVFNLLS